MAILSRHMAFELTKVARQNAALFGRYFEFRGLRARAPCDRK